MKLPRFLLRPAAVCFLAVTLVAARGRAADPEFIAPPPAPGIIIYPVSGQVEDLELKYNADQNRFYVHATLALHNKLDVALDHLTVRVYVSEPSTYKLGDLLLADVKLAHYLPKGKIAKHETVTLPLKRGVSSAMAAYLDGKYLNVVVSKDGLTYGLIKFGPIKSP